MTAFSSPSVSSPEGFALALIPQEFSPKFTSRFVLHPSLLAQNTHFLPLACEFVGFIPLVISTTFLLYLRPARCPCYNYKDCFFLKNLHQHHAAVYFPPRRSLSHAASLSHSGLVLLGEIHNSQLLLSPAFPLLIFLIKTFPASRICTTSGTKRQKWRQLGRVAPRTCVKEKKQI